MQYYLLTSTTRTILKWKDSIKAITPAQCVTFISNIRNHCPGEDRPFAVLWLAENQLAGDSVTQTIIFEKTRVIYTDLLQ